jgi:hypothetical protein
MDRDALCRWGQRQTPDEYGDKGDFKNPTVAQEHTMQERPAVPRGKIDFVVEPVGVSFRGSPPPLLVRVYFCASFHSVDGGAFRPILSLDSWP